MSLAPLRPTVLVIDSDEARRRVLAQGLAEAGYEVVPAISPQEGASYLQALRPSLVVLPVNLLGDPGLIPFLRPQSSLDLSVIAVGEQSQEVSTPRWAHFLSTTGLTVRSVLHRLNLLLLSREVGVEVGTDFDSLVGELSHHPLLELLPALQGARVTGCLELPGGQIYLRDGRPTAAQAGPARALKAFCRIAQQAAGPFHFRLLDEVPPQELEDDVHALMARAIEDSLGEHLDPRTQVRVQMGPDLFATRFSAFQQEVLGSISTGAPLRLVLDTHPALDGEILHELMRLERLGIVSLAKPVNPVVVVTDSTGDLPPGEAGRHGVQVVPLKVVFGSEVFLDGVELAPKQFYERLEARQHHPFTKPPTKEDFLRWYAPLLPEQDIVSIHISEHIPSLTVVHARQAADELLAQSAATRRRDGSQPKIHVFDSRLASSALGLLTLCAGRMAARGLAADEIRQRVEAIAPRLHTFFIVDTLEFLARGGRIGKAQAWFGNLLGIKPILGLEDGRVNPVDRVRGGRQAQSRLVEIFAELVTGDEPCLAIVAHANAPVWGDRLARLLEGAFPIAEVLHAEMGPVIGTHVGPGTVGAVLFQPLPDEAPLVAPLLES
jgi:DegV family protein with EDD domain